MAQPIHCDWPECGQLADMLVSNLATGETLAYCGGHYIEYTQRLLTAIYEAAAGADMPADVGPGAPLVAAEIEAADTAADVARRLADPMASGGSSAADSPPDVAPSRPRGGANGARHAPAREAAASEGTTEGGGP